MKRNQTSNPGISHRRMNGFMFMHKEWRTGMKLFYDRIRGAFINRAGLFAGVLAVGGVRSGGQELTIQSVQAALLCQEMVVVGAIDYVNRGATARPATLNNLPLEKSECTFCGTCVAICPTGAIRKLTLEEKQYAVIGNATINRNICIAWEQFKVCLICDEVCPYDAVEFKMVTDEKGTLQRPFVIEDKCVGCGQCESACPVKGPAAIYVTPVNEVRKNSGSYITEKVKGLREVDDETIDFYQEQGVSSEGKANVLESGQIPDEYEDDKPPPGLLFE